MSEHAIREYLKTIGNGGGTSQETDPVFTASPAHGISAQDIADWNDKQEELVSGTNIKTINGQSLLGSGDLPVAPPVTSTDVPTADTIAEFDSDAHMNSTDMTTGSGSELEDFIDGLNVSGGSAFLDMFYPVGSYYETSDTTFDPNVKWGGTWVSSDLLSDDSFTMTTPYSANIASDFVFTASASGFFALSIVSTERKYVSTFRNGVAFIDYAEVGNSTVNVMIVPLKKGDTFGVAGLSASCYVMSGRTQFLAYDVIGKKWHRTA